MKRGPDPSVFSLQQIDQHRRFLVEKESGEEQTPSRDREDIVDDIGYAAGITYQDGEPLRIGAKEEDRDRHRWELDPASSEDYIERAPRRGA